MVEHFEMPNRFEALSPLMESITTRLEALGANAGAVYAANLALEELITNILKYGYDDAGEHLIHVDLAVAEGRFTLTLVDDGHAFDPFAQAAPDTSLPIHERPIGGLGIHFVRNLLDECRYERREGKNVVTVSKVLQPPDPQ